jgi:DNA-directed RNA polymerase specialized sigma24 family protein
VSHDETGFGDFFQASWERCLKAVAASTGNIAAAEDQVAEASARAWASWRQVSRHPAPSAWVVRTALNTGAAPLLIVQLACTASRAPCGRRSAMASPA